MKKCKMMALALLTSLFSLNTQAAVWTTVEVTMAGSVQTGETYLKMDSVSGGAEFKDINFNVLPALNGSALGIGLAAVTSNRQVVIYSNIDEVDEATSPTIYSIYLSKAIVAN